MHFLQHFPFFLSSLFVSPLHKFMIHTQLSTYLRIAIGVQLIGLSLNNEIVLRRPIKQISINKGFTTYITFQHHTKSRLFKAVTKSKLCTLTNSSLTIMLPQLEPITHQL